MTSAATISRRAFARWPFDGGATRASGETRSSTPSLTTTADYWIRVYRRAMACRFEVTLAGENGAWVPAARAALDHVDSLESRLTVFRDTSEVVRLNRTAAAGPVSASEDLFRLVRLCQELHHDTDGAFDITSGPLSRCWGFLRHEGRLPGADELASVMRVVGMHHVTADPRERCISFDCQQVELNFGAVGKGWALDRMAGMLEAAGVAHALLSAGRSSVKAVGPHERALVAGKHAGGWPISLTSPWLERPLAHLWLRSGALGTSGAGVQFFEVGGQRYGHVIDPRTGWPAGAALSVSVITSDAARADALSTAFFVGGIDLAQRYCDRHPSVLVVFTPDDERRRPIVVGEYAGADVEVV